MDRDSCEKFAADLCRQEVITTDWRKARRSAFIAISLAIVGLIVGWSYPGNSGIASALYALAGAFGLSVLALVQFRWLYIKKAPID
jgi:predicted Co/Zn/Cd cation transporter (cation efflux family)